jgi:pyroglutamyl-peptidase
VINGKVLVTGFDAYGSFSKNVSEHLVGMLTSDFEGRVVTEILRVSYQASTDRIQKLLKTLKPSALLMLGQTTNTRTLRIELKAVNADSPTARDNDEQVGHSSIVEDGKPEYPTTLPVAQITEQLDGLKIPYALSESAGHYVCNHVFYVAQQYIDTQGLATRSGFIHVPAKPTDTEISRTGYVYQGLSSVMEILLEAV